MKTLVEIEKILTKHKQSKKNFSLTPYFRTGCKNEYPFNRPAFL